MTQQLLINFTDKQNRHTHTLSAIYKILFAFGVNFKKESALILDNII